MRTSTVHSVSYLAARCIHIRATLLQQPTKGLDVSHASRAHEGGIARVLQTPDTYRQANERCNHAWSIHADDKEFRILHNSGTFVQATALMHHGSQLSVRTAHQHRYDWTERKTTAHTMRVPSGRSTLRSTVDAAVIPPVVSSSSFNCNTSPSWAALNQRSACCSADTVADMVEGGEIGAVSAASSAVKAALAWAP